MSAGRKRIAIVGGGISGLAAAYELNRPEHKERCDVTLFETSARLGGIVETVRQDGFVVECGPDSWVTEKSWARELAEELGLANEIIPSNDAARRIYLVQGRALTAMPNAMRMMVPTEWHPLLSSDLFSWQAKLAYLREPKRAGELKETALETRGSESDESVSEFVRRHFGDEVTEKIAGPLLAGVFGGDIRELSVRSVMAPFVKMEAEEGSLITALAKRNCAKDGSSSATFTTLASGLGTLTDRIAGTLPPNSVHMETPVIAMRHEAKRWLLKTSLGEGSFDHVLIAASIDATRALLASTALEPAAAVAALLPSAASSAIVVAFGFTSPASHSAKLPRGFGFLVPVATHGPASSVEQQSLLACTFVEQKFAHRAPEDGVLLRAFFGGATAESLLTAPDTHIIALAHRQLSGILGRLPEPAVTVVRRWPHSLPQYTVGHRSRMRSLSEQLAQLPGLSLIGNAYHGVGLPDLVRDSRETARNALKS